MEISYHNGNQSTVLYRLTQAGSGGICPHDHISDSPVTNT